MREILNLFVEFVKDVHFVGLWKYLKGYRPACRILRSRKEMYRETLGISPLAMVFGKFGRQMRQLNEVCCKIAARKHRPRRVEAIISAQSGQRHRKESIAA